MVAVPAAVERGDRPAKAPELLGEVRLEFEDLTRLDQDPHPRGTAAGRGLGGLVGGQPAREPLALRSAERGCPPGRRQSGRTVLAAHPEQRLREVGGTISPAEVADGPPLSDLVSALVDKAGHGDSLRVLRELGGGAVCVAGQPSASLAAMVRESTECHLDTGEIAVPLTAVQATGAAMVSGDPVRWLADFAGLVLPPALTLLSMGVALEAHGQNTLVVLRDGRPVRVLYRDLDGVRVSPRRLARCGFQLPPLLGTRAGDDVAALHTKLFGGLVSGVFSELVHVLARTRGVEPRALWGVVAEVARRVFAGLPDGREDEAALFGDTIPLKATVAMRLADDPGRARWTPLPNPLARCR
ncbi:IucA/IucC family C-terminal-domain containing protein [Streptomyces sp. NPDC005921]